MRTLNKPVLSPKFKRELANNNPIGMLLSEDDVQSWWDLVWLTFSTYGYTERGRRTAIIRWWSRVTEPEIERARARTERIQDETETAAIEERRLRVVPDAV